VAVSVTVADAMPATDSAAAAAAAQEFILVRAGGGREVERERNAVARDREVFHEAQRDDVLAEVAVDDLRQGRKHRIGDGRHGAGGRFRGAFSRSFRPLGLAPRRRVMKGQRGFPAMARLYVLGGNGWVPSPKRSTSCYALETRRSLILFDPGSAFRGCRTP
jgi:hypothetical protein